MTRIPAVPRRAAEATTVVVARKGEQTYGSHCMAAEPVAPADAASRRG